MMERKHGLRIHITGIVQGVGFRPFVYSLARRYVLTGWVKNTSGGVVIETAGSQEALNSFLLAMKAELPRLARIDTLITEDIQPNEFPGFQIIHSEAVEGAFQPISPDVGICPDCLRELFDPTDRRYRYPFINCTNCGPRFTIIKDIPYDRPFTTMVKFDLCPHCLEEYRDPLNRRFHAQPVACPICGPSIWFERSGEFSLPNATTGEDALWQAQQLLRDGKVLAVKGLGGFHLACDATNAEAVARLRERKLRVDKPFALMMPDKNAVEAQCYLSQYEMEILESHRRPVVLLKRKNESSISWIVAPNMDTLGVMLPYTPLHYLLMFPEQGIFQALVMTSGNLSEEPITFGNEEARERLAPLADGFLFHDRAIHIRCDDSVVRLVPKPKPLVKPNNKENQSSVTYFLRRSRGYAPDPISLPFTIPPTLAVGGELKNTFCLARDRYAFVSHHIGDMENVETLTSFTSGIDHYERLFRIKPVRIAYDLHPNYLATRYALRRGEMGKIQAIGVQHHHAHIAACMAENGLDGSQPVIGVAFDGTGYGMDGAIWGGEILLADYKSFERTYHLRYFPLPGGDAAIRHPARTALALLHSLGFAWEDYLPPVKEMSQEEMDTLQVQIDKNINCLQTSSMGRLFDAVAALAGIRQSVNYEAQAAIELEAALDEAETGSYQIDVEQGIIDPTLLIQAILKDIRDNIPVARISSRFHNGVANMVVAACKKLMESHGSKIVALSGGVWQNISLLNQTISKLSLSGFDVLIHQKVPANDGGLSLGQVMIASANEDA